MDPVDGDNAAQPPISLRMTPKGIALESAALCGMVFLAGLAALSWSEIPATAPYQLGMSGKVDAWEVKRFLLLISILTGAFYLILTLINRFPHKFTYPFKITTHNARQQYLIATSAIRWMKAETVWICTWVEWRTIQTAFGKPPELGPLFAALCLIMVLVTLCSHFSMAYRAR